MWNLLLIAIGLGLFDSLNPFTISTQIVLQPFVKKNHHVLYYIFGTYLSYLIGGLFIYWGIDKLLANWWRGFMAVHSMLVYSLEEVLGVTLVIAAIVLFVKHYKKGYSANSEEVKPPKTVHPAFLFLFGASNTIGDLPTAFPYLMFIGRVVEADITNLPVIILLAVYCVIYSLPLISIYVLYCLNKQKLERLIEVIRNRVTVFISWANIIFVAGIGTFFIIHGIISIGV